MRFVNLSIVAFKVAVVALLTLILTIAPAFGQQPSKESFAPTEEETKFINSAYDRISKAQSAYQKAQEQAELIMSNATKEVEASQLAGQLVLMRIGKAHGKDIDLYKPATGEDGKPVFVLKEPEVANKPKKEEEAKK